MTTQHPRVERCLGPDSLIGTARSAVPLPARGEAPHLTWPGYADPQVGTRVVVDFCLEGAGRLLPVSLRSPSLSGGVADGDLVEVSGKVRRGVLLARRVYNHTTGTLLVPTWRRPGIAVVAVVVLAVAAIVLVILAGL